jgi:hypothetical protein
MPTTKITTEIIHAAILGFEEQKSGIDLRIAELRAMLPGGSTSGASEPTPATRKKFSAASRRKMALAQKARWAKIKGRVAAPSESVKPKRRKMSAAARKAIGDAQRKRWAVQKAGAKK